jgi:hypothetical protein
VSKSLEDHPDVFRHNKRGNTMTTTQTLSDLQPGNEVAVQGNYPSDISIGIFSHYTPSGQIILKDGARFKPDGWRHEKNRRFSSSSHLKEVTPEIRTIIVRRTLKSVDWEKIEDGRVMAVLAILESREG